MNTNKRSWLQLLGLAVLAAAALWVVIPQGSKIDLTKIKIPLKREFKLRLGLDLQGGSHLVYQADFSQVKNADQAEALASVRDTVERRVNSFGVSEPVVQVSGTDRVIVELPGIKDVNEAIKQIGQTPLLEFRIQPAANEINAASGTDANIDVSKLFLPTGLSGKQLKRATADIQGGASTVGNQVVVRLEFDDEGKALFAKITQENINKQIAIFLDGSIISAPTVQTAITDGVAVITGNFTPDEAKNLATRLNSGALPVPIKLISQQNVGATLGAESVHQSVVGGMIGVLLVILFMLLYYRFPGLLAVLALALYAVLSIAVFKLGISFAAICLVGLFFLLALTSSPWFGVLALASYVGLMLLGGLSPVTLTLAGIAGFILSIGMAVDANILIFERMKEEVRSGKDFAKAVEDGFDRAWLSIRDSNISSLITITMLYLFGTPAIKGFAVTLGVGILVSMFTAISVTRTLMRATLGGKSRPGAWLTGMSKASND